MPFRRRFCRVHREHKARLEHCRLGSQRRLLSPGLRHHEDRTRPLQRRSARVVRCRGTDVRHLLGPVRCW